MGGRVAQGIVVRERRANFVESRDIGHRHGVGGWLDAGYIERLQFLDVAEDAAELRAEFFFLVGRELEPRQMRDIFDIKLSLLHAQRLETGVQSSKFKVCENLRQPEA